MSNRSRSIFTLSLALFAGSASLVGHSAEPDKDPINPPATVKDYLALAKLPDLGGIWLPDIPDQVRQEKGPAAPPWTPGINKQIDQLWADEKAGKPFPIIDHCFPTGMPSYMLITHNAFELLVTPGRITLLGEGDGNRLRRIYTDGRAHGDPDPSFHGHSVGHWEGRTLVVDTVALFPQAYLAVSESVGIPNNGDMHIVEHIYLKGADTLVDELDITANKVLSKPWHTARKYTRQREQKYDIVEGVCTQGQTTDGVDKNGNATFVPVNFQRGVPVGSGSK